MDELKIVKNNGIKAEILDDESHLSMASEALSYDLERVNAKQLLREQRKEQ